MTDQQLAEIRQRCEADLKDIPGIPEYKVDASGSVWSVFHNWRGYQSRRVKPRVEDGYLRVRLRTGGKLAKFAVHRLIAMAFHGLPKDVKMHVRHLNGIKDDNRPDNLRWGTAKENSDDMTRLGERPVGEQNGASKLTKCDLILVRELLRRGFPNSHIAALLKVEKTTINHVSSGETWAHARTDIPALLAEVDRLTNELSARPVSVSCRDHVHAPMAKRIKELEANLEEAKRQMTPAQRMYFEESVAALKGDSNG